MRLALLCCIAPAASLAGLPRPRLAAKSPPRTRLAAAPAVASLAVRGGAVGIGGPLSLLPPVTTLSFALATKQVTPALLIGIWSGCLLLYDGNPVVALLRALDTHVVDAVVDREHATVILFNLVLGATIGLVQKGGGAVGLATSLKRFAKDARSCLATACALAGLVFFDDYASILIVGNSFRPLLPALGVCREKFAGLLHFVAVAVSASMPVSSWIGQQVGMVSTATASVPKSAGLPSPFVLTLSTLPYRFFPAALLAFVAATVATGRDFGPMRDAVVASERAGVSGVADDGAAPDLGPMEPAPGTPLRASNALVPFGTIVAATMTGMVLDGRRAFAAANGGARATVVQALAAGNSVLALLWGSTLGCAAALGLLTSQKILNLDGAMATVVEGMKDVVEPIIVLALAWALGGIIGAAGTADFIAAGLTTAGLPAWALPASTSLLAYVISFATGSSFGTMGILFPLIGPLAWSLGKGDQALLTHCFGAVLGGSLFGNVFSPIADTTILTQLATRVPLTDHVKTAGPYAALVGGLCLAFGDLAVGLGLYRPVVGLGLVVAAQTAALRVFGKRSD